MTARHSRKAPPPSVAGGQAVSPLAWMLPALVIAGTLVYANSLSSPFILDDEDVVVRNQHITSFSPLSNAIGAPPQSSLSGRPLVSLSMAISYAMGGLEPAAYHAWNIAVLVATSLALFGLVRRTAIRFALQDHDWIALCVAMLWVLHPLNAEVVNYVTQRTESMMGLAYMVTLYASVRAMDEATGHAGWTAVAIAASAAGMASKESMVTAPVMVWLYDVVFVSRSWRTSLARHRMLFMGLAATWLVLLALNLGAPRSGSAGFGTAITPLTYVLNQGEIIVTYLKLSLWPSPLVADYGRTFPIPFASALPYLLIVIALLAATTWAWLRGHLVTAFLGTWFFITLMPSSSVVPIATEVGAERRMYLPLMAACVAIVLALKALSGSRTRMVTVALAICLVFAALTAARNREYHDPIRLWESVVYRRPHGRAHYNLGIALKAAGRTNEAVEHYRLGIVDEPAAHYALGFEAFEAGRLNEATTALREFLQLRPADDAAPKAALLLGQALVRQGRPADAERVLRDALEAAPSNVDAIGALADALLPQGKFAEAIATYRRYLSLVPDAANARHSLGLALANNGQEPLAVIEFQRAVQLNPRDAQFRVSLGTALASTGNLDEAIAQYREALNLSPNNPLMMSALALALADRGEIAESDLLFMRAIRLQPDNPAIRADYEAALALRRSRR